MTMLRRLAAVPGFEWGVAVCAHAPDTSPEDACVIHPVSDGVLIAVVDGARCGPSLSIDAQRAISLLESARTLDVIPLLRLCTDLVPATYGIVRGLASCNTSTGRMTWLGVSKFSGHIVRAHPLAVSGAELHLTRGGTRGLRLPPMRPFGTTLEAGDLLILATDEMEHGIAHGAPAHETAHDIAARILASHQTAVPDALVFVGRFLGVRVGHA